MARINPIRSRGWGCCKQLPRNPVILMLALTAFLLAASTFAAAPPATPPATQPASTQPATTQPASTQPAATQPSATGTLIWADSADHLLVQLPGESQPTLLRLIGLCAPVRATRDETGQEPWGTRAHQFVLLSAVQKSVRIESDIAPTYPGESARLAYVWIGDKLLNEELLAQGHAVLDTRPPNVKYVERLTAAQKKAREAQLGIWDPKRPLTGSPMTFHRQRVDLEAQAKEKIAALALKEFQVGCIIGNTRSKVFHTPGSKYYEQARTSKNIVFFKNTTDAASAGFTPSESSVSQ
jgi:micrococcal nuclease